jgi:hypothetical protein
MKLTNKTKKSIKRRPFSIPWLHFIHNVSALSRDWRSHKIKNIKNINLTVRMSTSRSFKSLKICEMSTSTSVADSKFVDEIHCDKLSA